MTCSKIFLRCQESISINSQLVSARVARIVFSNAAQKQELIGLIKRGKIVPAIRKVQEMSGAEERLVKEYINRLRKEMKIESGYYD